MFVLIAGGGRTGTYLANLLIAQQHHVHLIEHRPEVLARIHHEVPTEVVYEGDVTEPVVLEQAGIQRADVIVACTNSDADNLALCFLARTKYNVGRTVARVNNPRTAWLFDHKFHVDVRLNQAEVMAALIEEGMSLGDMMTLLKLPLGDYAVVEQRVTTGAKAVGVALKDLALPDHCVIAAIMRHSEVIVPRGITTFEVGDDVLAVTNRRGAETLAKLLSAPNAHPQAV